MNKMTQAIQKLEPDLQAIIYDWEIFPEWAQLLLQVADDHDIRYLGHYLKMIKQYPNLLKVPIDQDEFVPMPDHLVELFPEVPTQIPKRLEGHIQYAAQPFWIERDLAKESTGEPGAIRLDVRQHVAMNIANNFAFKSISQRQPDDSNEYGTISTLQRILNGRKNLCDWPGYYREFDKACKEEGVTQEAIAAVTEIRKGVRIHIGGGVTNEVLLPVFFNLVNKGWNYRFLNI